VVVAVRERLAPAVRRSPLLTLSVTRCRRATADPNADAAAAAAGSKLTISSRRRPLGKALIEQISLAAAGRLVGRSAARPAWP